MVRLGKGTMGKRGTRIAGTQAEVQAGLGDILAKVRLVVSVGAGGVGKTSTSAAMAIHGACEGRRSLVLTIDPARRLANALGLAEFGNQERVVEPEAFRACGLEPPSGRLSCMMLDVKSAWDEVVRQHHPDAEARARLVSNRLFGALSRLAGSQEYMAMEKLYELANRTEDPLDFIVLDTPPTEHAFDFLNAPSRILDALDNEATRWILEPFEKRGRITDKLFDAGSSFLIRSISRFTGPDFLQEIAELLSGFQGMFDGFKERAKAVRSLFKDQGTAFVLVGTPDRVGIEHVREFDARLRERGIDVAALVLNRSFQDPFRHGRAQDSGAFRSLVFSLGGTTELVERVDGLLQHAQKSAQSQSETVAKLKRQFNHQPMILVPEFDADVHDLVGLKAMGKHLFARGSDFLCVGREPDSRAASF